MLDILYILQLLMDLHFRVQQLEIHHLPILIQHRSNIANINTQAFNSNIDLSSVTGNITPGGVPFDSAGASQASNFTLF
jgi:hypothetical protein